MRDILEGNKSATTRQWPSLYRALGYTVSVLHNSPEPCLALSFLVRKWKLLSLSTNPALVRGIWL